MAKRIGLIVLAFALVAALALTGCAPARRPLNSPGQNDIVGNNVGYNNTGYGNIGYGNNRGVGNNLGFGNNVGNPGILGNERYTDYPNLGDNLGVRNWNNNYRTDMYNTNLGGTTGTPIGTTQADDLARACERVQGVDDATVVVTGNTAYVGIDLERNTRVANERDIKRAVAQMVRASGRDINTVYVSTEMDFMDRLRNVGNGLRNGRPVDAFTTELDEMVRRITPTRW